MSSDRKVEFFSKTMASASAVEDPYMELSENKQKVVETQKHEHCHASRIKQKQQALEKQGKSRLTSEQHAKQLRTNHTILATAASRSFPKLWRRAPHRIGEDTAGTRSESSE
jgi:hypothetical protein